MTPLTSTNVETKTFLSFLYCYYYHYHRFRYHYHYHRYIKGRVSYDQVNNAIDEIHKVITAKYKILRLPRSAMGEPVMKKYKVSTVHLEVHTVCESDRRKPRRQGKGRGGV